MDRTTRHQSVWNRRLLHIGGGIEGTRRFGGLTYDSKGKVELGLFVLTCSSVLEVGFSFCKRILMPVSPV